MRPDRSRGPQGVDVGRRAAARPRPARSGGDGDDAALGHGRHRPRRVRPRRRGGHRASARRLGHRARRCDAIRLVLDHLRAGRRRRRRPRRAPAPCRRRPLLAGRSIDAGGTGHRPLHRSRARHARPRAPRRGGRGRARSRHRLEHRRRSRRVRPGGRRGRRRRWPALAGRCTAICCEASRFASVVGALGPLEVDVDDLADTMVAEENQPMYDNNCRHADDAERRELAAATLRLWDELRGAA